MIIRKCNRLEKLDNEEITVVDRDVAKCFENNDNATNRPNTSLGVPHTSNKKEEFFQNNNFEEIHNENVEIYSEIMKENKTDNLKIEELEIINNEKKDVDKNLDIIGKKTNDVKILENAKTEANKFNNNANNINNATTKVHTIDKKKITKNETLSTYAFKNKIISQVEYIPKNNITTKNKTVILFFKISRFLFLF